MSLEVNIKKRLGGFTLDVAFSAGDGVLALLGASGCGKSMTLRCIAGIERPDEGRIVLGDRVLFDSAQKINLPPQKRRVGLLFQNYALFPTMTVEQNIAAMPSVTEMLRAGKTPQDMMELAMAGFDPQVLDTREVKYQCDCSKERTKDMLLSLGRKELVKLRDEDPKCEVVCHFCHTKYEFDLNELLAETTPEEK